jgi:hypothetical protein
MRVKTGSNHSGERGEPGKDLGWALALAIAGGASMLLASRWHWSAGDLSPGLEGCLTTAVVGFVMVLLHGLPYRHALALASPVVAAMYLVMAAAEGRALATGITGMALTILGVLGVALALGDPRAAAPAAADGPLAGRTAMWHSSA